MKHIYFGALLCLCASVTANAQIKLPEDNRQFVDNLMHSGDSLFFTVFNADSSKYYFGYYDSYSWHFDAIAQLAPADTVYEMLRDSNYVFWIGCSKGLLTYDLQTFTVITFDTVKHIAFSPETDTLWGISGNSNLTNDVFFYTNSTFYTVPDTAFGDSLFLEIAVDTLSRVFVFGTDSTYVNDTVYHDTMWVCLDTMDVGVSGWRLRSNVLSMDSHLVYYAVNAQNEGWLVRFDTSLVPMRKLEQPAIWRYLQHDESDMPWFLRAGNFFRLTPVGAGYREASQPGYYEHRTTDHLAPTHAWRSGLKFLRISDRRCIVYGKNSPFLK